ncbi:pteridine reductase [Arenimonas sp. GDDSR-1]|uniref:pteridine reductase n=1 Tax=Arenimonas sp. GDDSR-1 TaxID=2950125 RepID=UPI002630E299|nr:pteridine reductase [Arenimonas sp. GDDSR-1]
MTNDSAVILITGAGRRIGAALAADLHARGYRIALHYQNSERECVALCADFNRIRPDSAMTLQADLGEASRRDALVPAVLAQFGRLDVLINNASSFFPTPVGTSTDADWDALFDANARAPYFLSQAAAPHLAKQSGCIVNLLDIFAERPKPGHTLYGMAKAAQRMLTRSLALELAPSVRVNAIAPGAILWPESGKSEAQKQAILDATPLARIGQVADICKAARFLIEDADYCTGQVIAVDGGRLLR